jgi:DNA polymerase-3 subunit delta'
MWQVVGHEWTVKLLERSLANGRTAHAYLLLGLPQVGKTTLALNFAQALNCLDEHKPCGQCRSCLKIAHGNHPDVRVIEALNGTIKIDQIRAMQREVALSPHEGRWKVYIIRQMERATTEAANCLLKTLEEPPAQVILMLTASDMDQLLPTIISRCQVLNLRPPSMLLVQKALEERWEIDPERARLLARLSGGRLGWAVTASEDEAILRKRQRRLGEMIELMGQGRVERLRYAQHLSQSPDGLREVLDLWLSWWRDLLLIRGDSATEVTNVDREAALCSQARGYSLIQVWDFIEALRTAVWQLEHNANTRLTLEVLMLSLPVT